MKRKPEMDERDEDDAIVLASSKYYLEEAERAYAILSDKEKYPFFAGQLSAEELSELTECVEKNRRAYASIQARVAARKQQSYN